MGEITLEDCLISLNVLCYILTSFTQFLTEYTYQILRKLMPQSDYSIVNKNIEYESLLTIIDEVPMESEDIHIVYCVAKQIQFEVTAEQGAKLNPTDDVTIYYSIEPQTSEISRVTCKQRVN
ncbi:unnamed protein product [Rotaria sordida]|uniref:Uncharacterized protein n=1 Tax=Rotaria sordida TaxID=392033 RepID=A0A820A6U7_9BILA|nr:unnamed protein product [Rotaria sordida]